MLQVLEALQNLLETASSPQYAVTDHVAKASLHNNVAGSGSTVQSLADQTLDPDILYDLLLDAGYHAPQEEDNAAWAGVLLHRSGPLVGAVPSSKALRCVHSSLSQDGNV